MGSYIVTCHPTQVNAPRVDLPTPEGWKAELTWVVFGYTPRWFTCPKTFALPGVW